MEQLHGSLKDIGAHLDFQKPELLIKELWSVLYKGKTQNKMREKLSFKD